MAVQMTETLVDEMKAVGFDTPGGPDVLESTALPMPKPGDREVLVKVAYAGVNRPDVIQRKGHYPPPKGASPIPGLEIAGTIVAAGEKVPGTMIGKKICALVSGGGYAQYCLANYSHCLEVPDNLPLEQAAAIPETLFTVWHNVFERGWAKDGETLLVHGGTSGIGTMAIKLAKLFDMQVIVTCGSEQKCAAAREIGADHAINYHKVDFAAAVDQITDGAGVQIVLDMVSGEYVPRNLACLAQDGRHITIAVLGGMQAELNMALIMSRRLTLSGSTLRIRSDEFKTLLCDEIAANVWPMVETGELRPEMDRIFPMDQAAQAHKRMEAGEHIGKIVLKMDEE